MKKNLILKLKQKIRQKQLDQDKDINLIKMEKSEITYKQEETNSQNWKEIDRLKFINLIFTEEEKETLNDSNSSLTELLNHLEKFIKEADTSRPIGLAGKSLKIKPLSTIVKEIQERNKEWEELEAIARKNIELEEKYRDNNDNDENE